MNRLESVLVLALGLLVSAAAGQEVGVGVPDEEGFAHLSAAPLDSVAWVTGRLSQLDPESQDHDGERELLARVLAHLEAHPQVTRSALLDLRRDLRSRLSAAEAAFNEADESAREAPARQVLAAQQDIDQLETLLRDLRRHAVSGTPVPSAEDDLRRVVEEKSPSAAARLTLLLPFLKPEAYDEVRTTLESWREAMTAEAVTEAAAAGAVSALEQTDPGIDPLTEVLRDASLAEEALREAREQLEKRRDEIAAVEAGVYKRFTDSVASAKEIDARAIQPNDANGRQADAQALYVTLRGFVDTLREEVADAGGELIGAQRNTAAVGLKVAEDRRRIELLKEDSTQTVAVSEDLARWEKDLQERLRLSASRDALERSHRDGMFVLLKDVKTLRRGFADVVPAATRREDRQYLLADLDSEARLILPLFDVLARHRLQTLVELPSRWRDVNFWGSAFSGLLWFLLIAALWWILRRIADGAAPQLLRLWASRSQRYVPRDLWGMREASQRTLTSLVDLVAMGVMLGYVRATVPELGLVLLVTLQVTLYRLILGAAALAFATHPAVRPALLTLRPEARHLALRTVRYGVLWLIARQFLRYCSLEILGAATLEEALRLVFGALLIALAIWGFHAWEPYLREALMRRAPVHRLVVFQTRRQLGLLRPAQGLAHALLFVYLWAKDFVTRLGGWGSVLESFKRSRPEAGEEKPPEIPGEVVELLFRRDCPEESYLDRNDARDDLDERLRRWRTNKRRGVAVVLADSGMGKHTLLEEWCRSIGALGTMAESDTAESDTAESDTAESDTAESDTAESAGEGELKIFRLTLRERLTSTEDARSWLAESFGLENPPSDPEALAGRLQSELNRPIVVVEGLQLAFLRRVDGFAALNFLLSVVGSSCDQLLWVCSLHLPAWRYLSSLGGLVHTEVFHTQVELRPFNEDELRWIVEKRIAATSHEVGFSRLLPRAEQWRPNPLAIERVSAEYFRRLAWASQGNPTVALRLWRESLTTAGSVAANGRLEVARYPQVPGIAQLRDADSFLLAALYTHRSLTEQEIVEVTNMSSALVGAALKNLEGRRLLTTRSKRFNIEPRYLPAVTSDLRRRRFIHGSV